MPSSFSLRDVTKTRKGERGTGNGERGTGNGERGTRNEERGRGTEKKREQNRELEIKSLTGLGFKLGFLPIFSFSRSPFYTAPISQN